MENIWAARRAAALVGNFNTSERSQGEALPLGAHNVNRASKFDCAMEQKMSNRNLHKQPAPTLTFKSSLCHSSCWHQVNNFKTVNYLPYSCFLS